MKDINKLINEALKLADELHKRKCSLIFGIVNNSKVSVFYRGTIMDLLFLEKTISNSNSKKVEEM